MSHYAVEWRIFHPLTRTTLARVLLRTIDGTDYYVAVRDSNGQPEMLGSWDSLPLADESVMALWEQATGERIYGDDGIPPRRFYPQTPLPS